jgi:NTP pyrophosphatase (non-canonical NTP hydrolase)
MNDETYKLARERFDATAGMDAPELPADPMEALQTRLYRWQVNRFGLQPAERQVLGIVEELGEWMDANGMTVEKGEEAMTDAIADIGVFAIQLCTSLRLDAGTLMQPPAEFVQVKHALSIAGRLSHVCLKTLQRIRGMQDAETSRRAFAAVLVDLFVWCQRRAQDRGRVFPELVAEVAEVVMKRVPKNLPQVAA